MLRMERLFSSPLNSRDAPRRKNGAAKIRSVTLQERQGENEHAFSHGHYWKTSSRDRVMAATTPGSPPLWSACQCERHTASMDASQTPSQHASSSQTPAEGPPSKGAS